VPGVQELIEDGVNGVLVPPEDPQALADALAQAIAAPGLRRKLGAAGERKVREHFDYRASVARLVALFASIGIEKARKEC
jgi:glycosyltransferase involved in cell wall biosynthesis